MITIKATSKNPFPVILSPDAGLAVCEANDQAQRRISSSPVLLILHYVQDDS